ncbi:MAG TPA: PAS domain-containing protein, partial [Flavisolibacter sp.]|nr:PAS domain-containing protein [Flavisolibacter sp.]
PSDKLIIENEIRRSLESGVFDCEFRLLGKNGEKIMWSRGIVNYVEDKPIGLTGTVMDVTERHQILKELNQSDERYKQAEALTHIGNYIWNLETNEIKWSDELYRIYGLNPNSDNISFDFLSSFTEEDEKLNVRNYIESAIEKKENFDFYYKIILKGNKQKILHARGEIIRDENDKAITILGTTQDVTEKQNLISQLKLKESIYKQAEELANMGNWTWDLKTNVIEWTDQLYKIYGLEPQSEKITIDKLLSIIHPDDRDYVQNKITLIHEKKLLDYSFRIKTSGDHIKTIKTIARVMADKDGIPLSVVGTERDITEKQSLIDKLRNSETLYKQAQSLARLGNWSYDLNTKIFTWSDEMYHIYGLPSDHKITLEEVNSFIHPEDRQSVIDYFKDCIEHFVPYDKHHRIILRNGTLKTIHRKGTFVLDSNTNALKLIGTTQDVTELQNLIQRLEKSESLYKQAQQIAHLGNWSYDVKHKIFLWSEEMLYIFGVNKNSADVTWQNFFDRIHPDDKDFVQKTLSDVLESGKDFEISHRVLLSNGEQRIISERGRIEKDKSGASLELIGTSQDVTEQYRIEKELRDNQTFIQKITDATPSIIAS